jgi:hypothetical protein
MMTLVWELELPDSEKLVLLALADCANDEGHCWPGMTALKKKCSKSDRTVQIAIKMLCAKGHLTRREVPGKGCNYTVHPIVRFASTPEESAPRRICAPKGTTQTPEAASGKPSRTINTEAKASCDRVVSRWNERSKESGIPAVRVLNHSRTQMLLARVREHGEAVMLEAVDNVHASLFCRGLRGDGRKADIMFILQPKTLPRVLEGFYGQDNDTPIARKYISPSGHEYRGDEEAVMKQAERRADWNTYWLAKARLEERKAA